MHQHKGISKNIQRQIKASKKEITILFTDATGEKRRI